MLLSVTDRIEARHLCSKAISGGVSTYWVHPSTQHFRAARSRASHSAVRIRSRRARGTRVASAPFSLGQIRKTPVRGVLCIWPREWDRITSDLTNSICCRKPLRQVSFGCFLDHSRSRRAPSTYCAFRQRASLRATWALIEAHAVVTASGRAGRSPWGHGRVRGAPSQA